MLLWVIIDLNAISVKDSEAYRGWKSKLFFVKQKFQYILDRKEIVLLLLNSWHIGNGFHGIIFKAKPYKKLSNVFVLVSIPLHSQN